MRCFLLLSLLAVQTYSFAPISTLSLSSQVSSSQQHYQHYQQQQQDGRLFSTSSSTTIEIKEGLLKTITKPGTGQSVKRGDLAVIKYSCYVPDSAPFARSASQRMTIGSGDMIDGWEEALHTMSVGERAVVRITDPNMGYGAAGVPPLIPPNSELEIDIEVISSQARAEIDFESLAVGNPETPRTAESIAAAYDNLMEKKALEPQKEGLEGMIETVKGWYFFGLFEGETGEETPWILKPSITFPLAFLIVGATFYVAYAGGGINERGAQVTDDLDQIILSMQTTTAAAMTEEAPLSSAAAFFATAATALLIPGGGVM